jgi:hypothetical protein
MHVDNKTWTKKALKMYKKIKHNNQTNKQSLIYES